MFAELPENVKKTVLFHLHKNEFVEAKAVHDKWIATNSSLKAQQQPQTLLLPAPSYFSRLRHSIKELKFSHFIIEFLSLIISLTMTGIVHVIMYLMHYHHIYMIVSMMFSHVLSWLSSSAIMTTLRRLIPAMPKHSFLVNWFHKIKF